MLESFDTDLTLPSVVAALAARSREQELALTIIFHPDTARIGQRAVVPVQRGNNPWVLGRRSPTFGGVGEDDAIALHDRHVSRRALQFIYSGKRLTIRRFDGASRCRLGSGELYDSVELEGQQLRAGVPIMLGHSVVLMLRVGPPAVSSDRAGECEQLLRGGSVCMKNIREQVARAADSDMDVLILGETGTGKELVATAIHRASRRQAAPMISVNMAAIPPELAPAALFGSSRGAFTGADRSADGYFEQAQGGSLFLDEIGDTSAAVQPQLLRALQQREIQAVGGAIRRVDLRVISATDAALDEHGCGFKAALRHRLGACEIRLPALREHPEDVGELLMFFLRQSALEEGCIQLLPQAQGSAFNIAAWAGIFFKCVAYNWPGNVRELANVARQVILASETTPTLAAALRPGPAGSATSGSQRGHRAARRKIQDIDDAVFDSAMQDCGFEPGRVAQQLGVSRSAVYRRIGASTNYRLVSEITAPELHSQLLKHGGSSKAVAAQLRVPLNNLRSHLRKLPFDWH